MLTYNLISPHKPSCNLFQPTIFLFFLFMAFGFTLHGQRTITGTVFNEEQEPLIGAPILVVGSLTGTITDVDGGFQLAIPEEAEQIKVSYLGYVTQTIDIGNEESFEIILAKAAKTLAPRKSKHIVVFEEPIKEPAVVRGRLSVGANYDKNFNLLRKGKKTTANGQTSYMAEFTVPNDSILENVYILFARFYVPRGTLTITNADSSVQKVVKDVSQKRRGRKYVTKPISGNKIQIIYTVPEGTSVSDVKIKICGVGYYYKSGRKRSDISTDCFSNLACNDTLLHLGRSIVRWNAPEKKTDHNIPCTGVLINQRTTAGERRAFILTALHCLECVELGQAATYFNHQTTGCNDNRDFTTPIYDHSIESLEEVLRIKDQDLVILELLEKPRDEFGARYAGWDLDAQPTAASGPVYAIHHPDGQPKAFSRGRFEADTKEDFYVITWHDDSNPTHFGSSGSPIFLDNKVIGILHGGDSNCDNRGGVDYYGKARKAWEKLARLLDPGATGQRRMDGE